MKDHPYKRKMIIVILERIKGLGPGELTLPENEKTILDAIPYLQLIKPLIIYDRKSGLSWKQIAIKYNISPMQARNLLKIITI